MTVPPPPLDPHKLAIALGYERGVDIAPQVVAKGKGFIAQQIIRLAQEHGITIRQDQDLARVLSVIDIGEPIPLEAYAAVAEILSYIYRLNDKKKAGMQ